VSGSARRELEAMDSAVDPAGRNVGDQVPESVLVDHLASRPLWGVGRFGDRVGLRGCGRAQCGRATAAREECCRGSEDIATIERRAHPGGPSELREVDPMRAAESELSGERDEHAVIRADKDRAGAGLDRDRLTAAPHSRVDDRDMNCGGRKPPRHFAEKERGLVNSVSGQVMCEVDNRCGKNPSGNQRRLHLRRVGRPPVAREGDDPAAARPGPSRQRAPTKGASPPTTS